MSWSVSAIGKAAAVAASIETQFSQSTCSEPEESVRQSARATIAAALAAQDPRTVVKVMASGSQSQRNYGQKDVAPSFTNSLTINVEPQYGFVE